MTTEPTRAADALVADARRAVHEALIVLAAPEADRVRSLIADLETAVEGRTAIRFTGPVVVPPADQAALRDRIAAALYERERPPRDPHWPDVYASDREVFEAMADAVLAALPATSQTAEEHRIALSMALGLGTGAPWDAIHDRATELGLPPIDQDPVARRLGLLPVSGRAATLREAADVAAAQNGCPCNTGHTIAYLLRRLAGEAEQPEPESPRRRCAHTDIVYGRCVRFMDDHDGECVHDHQPARAARQDPTPDSEAHPPEHTWAAELHDPLVDEWVPGTRFLVRDRAVNALEHGRRLGPTWRDGTPTERRLVRATTTYTVEPDPAVSSGQPSTPTEA